MASVVTRRGTDAVRRESFVLSLCLCASVGVVFCVGLDRAVPRYEGDDLPLGPVAIVDTVPLFHKSAMTAVWRELHGDIGIAGDGGVAERPGRHERIVGRRNDEGRHRNAVNDPHGARPMVVIGSVAKTVMRCRVCLVELTDGSDGR